VHQAIEAIEIYRQIPIRFAEVELEDALRSAAELDLCAYDAYLIRCGLKYNAPLISLDRKLVELAQKAGASVIEVKL
jgi:predicted nucleic acid-binding protein